MNAKRASNNGLSLRLARWVRPVWSKPALVAASVAVVILLAIVAQRAVWRHWGQAVVNDPRHRVTAEHIEATPQPAWIRADVTSQAIQQAGLTDLSLLDPQITVLVMRAFKLHPWVADVVRVQKRPGPRILVEVVYRRPVAWVEVPAEPFEITDATRGLLPVDGSSVVLPTQEFSRDQAGRYLRINVGDTIPSGLVGTPWGDRRVAGAALVAERLLGVWQVLGLHRIGLSTESPERGDPVYELQTRSGQRIVWGHAPGKERPGEPSAAEKIAYLNELADRLAHDPAALDDYLDLRDRRAAVTRARHGPLRR